MPNHCQCCASRYQTRVDTQAHRNARIYGSEWHQERIRPCPVVVEREVSSRGAKLRFQVIRPLCCFADCHQILMILTCAALLYSIVALVLTCIYAPNPFFISTLAFSILTMLAILSALLSGSHKLLKVAFILTVILCFLVAIGAVICAFYLIKNFNLSKTWEWKLYLVSMLTIQVIMIFYVIALLFLVCQLIAYNRRVCEEERRVEPIARHRRY